MLVILVSLIVGSLSVSFFYDLQVQHGNGETGLLAAPERSLNHPVDNLPEIDYFSDGDFLELRDLADPVSPSSSSDNSSCLSQTSDECFDSLALLRDLESHKDVGCKFSVAASVMPDKVVLQPASSGIFGFLSSTLLIV